MKVLMINGSPNEKSCTYTALAEAAGSLELAGIEAEIAWIGKSPIRGCQSCGGCSKGGVARCIY
ncbi:MAG: NAD(P)H-dependent oxidoreductase, partial [Eggerthellaceae bacterium]|nr:NAD(P)H-dependent oxidoreductase [Eggerthellaceae bacterium]